MNEHVRIHTLLLCKREVGRYFKVYGPKSKCRFLFDYFKQITYNTSK